MDSGLLAQADQIIKALSPCRRESIREVVVDGIRRGYVSSASRAYLDRVTGSAAVGEVLVRAVAEMAGPQTTEPDQLSSVTVTRYAISVPSEPPSSTMRSPSLSP